MATNEQTISVIGLGKLGASMAAAIASRGIKVIGVDINQRTVELLRDGRPPVQETDLEQYIAKNHSRIRATTDHVDAICNSHLSFIIVPTPSDERGAFSLRYAVHAFREMGRALKQKNRYHLFVMTSTVLPGATRYGLLPELERESGMKCGEDFGLCYSPEFIALGSVIRDFLNPDFNLIGEFDRRSGDLLEACYAEIMLNQPPVRRMSLENAELTKVALNTYVTTKITFANMLAEICERIPGGDIDVVTNALGLDIRIGRKYLTGALGYGGPCFPRDNVALSFFARAIGTSADLAETTDHLNRALADRSVVRLKSAISPDATVAVLGLSYKPKSVVIEESQGVRLVKALSKAGWRVLGHDPLANDAARVELQYHALVVDSLEACIDQADVIVIANPDPAFKVVAKRIADSGKKVIDFWRLIDEEMSMTNPSSYSAYGRGQLGETAEVTLKDLWIQK